MSREPVDYYAVLQVNPAATLPVIEAAYQAMATAEQTGHDPLVTEAYQVLTDPDLRNSYDRWYVTWTANNPDLVRAEARRRARREAGRRTRAAVERLGEAASKQAPSARAGGASSVRRGKVAVARRTQTYRQGRDARRARARELPPIRRNVILHPVVAVLSALLVLALMTAAAMLPLRIAAEREEQASAREAQVAADAEAARVAQEEADRAAEDADREAAEVARQQAEDDARTSEEAARAVERKEAAEKALAARQAQQEVDEAARQECLSAVTGTGALTGCDLSDVDLKSVDLTNRDLTDVSFAGADLTGAFLDGATLTGVRWSGATCPDGATAESPGGCTEHLLEPGDGNRPLSIGQSTRVGDWTVAVTSYQADAGSNARVMDWIGDEPGDGFVYAIVGFAVRYEGTGQNESPGGNLDFDINGVSYLSADTLCSLPVQDSGGWVDGLNTGQSTSYEQCMYLPIETATSGVIGVYDGYSFEADEPTAYWAIP